MLKLDICHIHLYRKYDFSVFLTTDVHTGYCKQSQSEQSDKCRCSCIKKSSWLGCMSTRLLFLSVTALFPVVFSLGVASENATPSTFLMSTLDKVH